jgi:hypothetical protein
VGLQPGGDRLGGAVLAQIDRTAPVQSHHDGALAGVYGESEFKSL